MDIDFWGHRGSQTDNARSIGYDRPGHPAENTLAAFAHALDHGANGIELDVMRVKDAPGKGRNAGDILVVTHTNDSAAHCFGTNGEAVSHGFMADLSSEQAKALRVGPNRDGEIPTLNEALRFFAEYEKKTGRSLTLNIEMKDVKDTAFTDLARSDIVPLLTAALAHSPLNPNHIVLSSFALSDLERMAKAAPGCRLGLLCYGKPDKNEPLYPAIPGSENHVPFTPLTIEHAMARVPTLASIHPEINDIDAPTMRQAAVSGLAVNPWFLNEERPHASEQLVREKIAIARDAGIEHMNIISNFAGELRRLTIEPGKRVSADDAARLSSARGQQL